MIIIPFLFTSLEGNRKTGSVDKYASLVIRLSHDSHVVPNIISIGSELNFKDNKLHYQRNLPTINQRSACTIGVVLLLDFRSFSIENFPKY